MAEETFETFMAKERERLTKKREDVTHRQQKLAEELDAVDKELMAIDAYEAVKLGKTPMKRRASSSRAPRGAVRGKVLETLKSKAGGMSRGEILEALGAIGNEKSERSISSALSAMKKAGQLTAKDGKYTAA